MLRDAAAPSSGTSERFTFTAADSVWHEGGRIPRMHHSFERATRKTDDSCVALGIDIDRCVCSCATVVQTSAVKPR